jgi:DNA-binding NarL/FixJ family response regulator/Arc/MetJ family transcription regulator
MPVAEGGRRTSLVGRREEMASLVAALDDLRTPGTRWVAISGEPGTGKTRLLGELSARAQAREHTVLLGRGAELERALPFGIWVDALDDHAAGLGRDRLETLIGDCLGELERVLPSVSAGPVPPGGLQDERFRAYRAVRALLARLALRRPVVVVLDDVHWADDASLELLTYLLRRPPQARVMFALGFRVGQLRSALPAALEAAARDASFTEVRLAPLSRGEADTLVGEELPAHVRKRLYADSGGNPFYLQELARATGPRAQATGDHEAGGVPGAVRVALAQEIAGLGEPAHQLAWGAAVGGDPVDFELAAAAADLSQEQALGAIDELLARDVLRVTDVSGRYAFRHPIVRRAVYESASEAWRLRAHARAAALLQDRPSALSARAHHIERCGRTGDAAAAAVLEQAALQSATRAPAIAARWLTSALRLLPELPEHDGRRLGLLISLAGAQAATGRLEEAITTLEEAIEKVPASLPDLRVRLIAVYAACENPLGRHAAAHARLLCAFDALPERDTATAAALQVELAADALYDSDFAAMRRWAQAGAETARALGDRGLETVAAGLLCFAEYGLGHAAAAERARVAGAALLDALPDEELVARLDAPNYLGFAEYFCEHYEDAARHFRRGIAQSRAVGLGQFVVQMRVGLAHALERLGRLSEALEAADSAAEAARLSGHRQLIGFALVAEAMTATELGDIDHARAAAEEAVALLVGLDESVLTNATHAHVGVVWLEIGEPDRCIDQLRSLGLPDFPQIEPGRRGWLYAALARAELARGNRDAAAEWVERSESTARALELPLTEAWALHAHASLSLADGDDAQAAELAIRAGELASAVHSPVPAARCRMLAGIALAHGGDREQAVRLIAEAERELGSRGANRYRDEAARELRRLGLRVAARQRRSAASGGLEALSGREREIAERVALGRTNREIAAELFLSEKTVEGHMTSIFGKLGVTARAAVAEAVGRSHTPSD